MIKGTDKDEPDYTRTLIVCSSNDTYLNWSEESMAVDGSEIKNIAVLTHNPVNLDGSRVVVTMQPFT